MRVLNEANTCPICESHDLDYCAIQLEDNMGYFPWTCNNCETTGEEWYNMNFSGHNLNIENDNYELPYIDDKIVRKERIDKGVNRYESDRNPTTRIS